MVQVAVKNVAQLKVGQRGVITRFLDPHLSLKLLEMGCLPGTSIRLDCAAPLGCPVCITVGEHYHLSLRKSEAETIEVEAE